MKTISILGSTGSIGRSCLKVAEHHSSRFRVVAMAAGDNISLLAEQIAKFSPELVSVSSFSSLELLKTKLDQAGVKNKPLLLAGGEGLSAVATHAGADILVSAVVGIAGLYPTYEAILQGKTIALANKEILVVAGQLVTQAASRQKASILPVDSEHNAIHQCLRAGAAEEVRRILLTASGGPFREMPWEEMKKVTPQMALHHPTWNMGKRITIDSSTLMNKGFEVLEAQWLFDMPVDRVSVLIHPQSIVHSMVEFEDGAVLAQLGVTDMRHPIQYALTYPERLATSVHHLDFAKVRTLEFHPPDLDRFPCLGLAYQAAQQGGFSPCILNAADEIAVEAFLKGRIQFTQIPEIIARMMKDCPHAARLHSIQAVLDQDLAVRRETQRLIDLDYHSSHSLS